MTPRIHVVCAPSFGVNNGMLAVDRGLPVALADAGIDAEVACFTPEVAGPSPATAVEPEGVGRTSPLGEHWDRFLDADALLYWGDFLHMASYRRTVGDRLVRAGRSSAEAAELADRFLFLDGESDEVRSRTALFGGTLLLNAGSDYRDARYGAVLHEMLGGAGAVWMRDPYSAATVARHRTDAADHLGVDAALLLARSVRSSAAPTATATVGTFFGRTKRRHRLAIARFLYLLRRAGSFELAWIPWGEATHFTPLVDDPFVGRALGASAAAAGQTSGAPPNLDALLQRIRSHRAIVTDTYHLAVLAWGLGVPTVCVADTTPDEPWSVSAGPRWSWRDKREVFLATHDAQEHLVRMDELHDLRGTWARCRQLIGALEDHEATEAIVARIEHATDAAQIDLARWLRGQLGLPGPGALQVGSDER